VLRSYWGKCHNGGDGFDLTKGVSFGTMDGCARGVQQDLHGGPLSVGNWCIRPF